jgi:hypothetical protein
VSEAERWVSEHLSTAPSELVEVMLSAVRSQQGKSVADTLAAAAIELYRSVAAGTGSREDALPLLAADALYTHAFEAAVEDDPAKLGDFAARWGGRGKLREMSVDVLT